METIKLNDYVRLCSCLIIVGAGYSNLTNRYNNMFFHIPRIYCVDGFNISIQVNNGNYCESENGIRTFGYEWKEVEWGYPSEILSDEKYKAEDERTTSTVGGYVDIDIMQELLDSHGGIDFAKTVKEFNIDKYKIV